MSGVTQKPITDTKLLSFSGLFAILGSAEKKDDRGKEVMLLMEVDQESVSA